MTIPVPPSSAFTNDVVAAAGYGYHRVWAERDYLLRMAMVPIALKLIGMLVIVALDYGDNFLRQGLILLPAMLAEGWLVAQFLRTLLMEERWPVTLAQTPSPEVVQRLLLRARGIVAATLVYVLIGLASFVVKDVVFQVEEMAGSIAQGGGEAAAQVSKQPLSPAAFVPVVLLLLAAIWAFRLVWIYIPFSVLMGPRVYLRALGGFMTSVRMVATFLFCVVPPFFLAVLFSQMVYSALGGDNGGFLSLADFSLILISTVVETIVVLVSTAAMAWGMKDVLPRSPLSFLPFEDDTEDY
jgi:hypothetical protein